jgi:hypothetical protein
MSTDTATANRNGQLSREQVQQLLREDEERRAAACIEALKAVLKEHRFNLIPFIILEPGKVDAGWRVESMD